MLQLSKVSGFERLQNRLFLAIVVAIAAVLLLYRLDDVYLWQDEAETALVARHLMTYGLPLSTDGLTWVQQAPVAFREFTHDYVWVYHPWLQYAATAISFAMFGQNTWAARLPFALAGLAAIGMLYILVSTWQPDRRIARVATIVLVFCVPYILLVRQCRYYALSALLALVVLDSYLRLEFDRPWTVPYFVLSSVLLFHSEYGAFFPVMAALMTHALLVGSSRAKRHRLVLGLGLIGLITLPWTRLIPAWHSGSSSSMALEQGFAPAAQRTLERFLGLLGRQTLQITAWIFPLVLVPPLVVGLLAIQRGALASSRRPSRLWLLLALVIAANVTAFSFLGWSFFRYLTHLIPMLVMLLAVSVVWVIGRWPSAGYLILATLLMTNGLHILPYRIVAAAIPEQSQLWVHMLSSPATRWIAESRTLRLRSDPWMYAQELTHAYAGPNEGLVAYLSTHAEPGQTVLVNYEDLPLQFYTHLRVLGGLSAHGLTAELAPDWVIDRRYGPYRDLLAAILAAGSYERITIPYPDIHWENREEASKHQYLTDSTADHVVLYRRLGVIPAAAAGGS